MNDFTKEELQILWLELSGNHYLELKNKIQSMIDKYCEHQKDILPLYTASGDLPCAALCYECDNPIDVKFLIDGV